MARLKIVGYVDTDSLDPDQLDPEHATGLTDEAYDDLITGENGRPLGVSDLEDVEVTVEK